jgi:hypothetical protein
MTYDEALERARFVVHGIHQELGDKSDLESFRVALRERLASDSDFNDACRLCGLMTVESWQATRH